MGMCLFIWCLSLGLTKPTPFYLGLCQAQEKQVIHLLWNKPWPVSASGFSYIVLWFLGHVAVPLSSLLFQSSLVTFPLSPFLLLSTGLAWISCVCLSVFQLSGPDIILFCFLMEENKIRLNQKMRVSLSSFHWWCSPKSYNDMVDLGWKLGLTNGQASIDWGWQCASLGATRFVYSTLINLIQWSACHSPIVSHMYPIL